MTSEAKVPNAIDRIHEFLRFGSKLGLERMKELLKRLGNPEKEFRAFHIAGTNGKGSVARYIYESLMEAGYKAGLYTSPYLEVFNERIEFMREYISDAELETETDIVLDAVKEMVASGYESPTEFEVVTAIAMLYFRDMGCNIAVLEVGLGGSGDSTNVIEDPIASVITSISFDHMDRLGNTISEIAQEKAGIIKPGRPVVISTERPDAEDVFRHKADALGSSLYDVYHSATYDIKDASPLGSTFDIALGDLGETADDIQIKDITLSMPGIHQIENAALAISAMYIARINGDIDIKDNEILSGIKRAKMPGRFEVLHYPKEDQNDGHDCMTCPNEYIRALEKTWIIIDGAHNQDAAVRLRTAIDTWFPGKKILVVCGMLADKKVDDILDEFCSFGTDFIATEPANPRKVSAYDLAKNLHKRDKTVYEVPVPSDATALAMSLVRGYDLVLFTGSLYLIGEVRTLLREHYLAL